MNIQHRTALYQVKNRSTFILFMSQNKVPNITFTCLLLFVTSSQFRHKKLQNMPTSNCVFDFCFLTCYVWM